VWSPKAKGYYIWREARLFSFLLLEYDYCLLNWIRVDFTPQIQINKQTEKTIYDLMNPTHIPKEVLLPDWACRGISGKKGDRVHVVAKLLGVCRA
jgi:hypothetical protein